MHGLVEILQRGRARNPEGVVASADGVQLTWSELDDRSDRIAHGLIDSGVEPGDRVALLLDRSLEALQGIFGTWKAGAAYVPLDPMSPPTRNRALISDCGARMILSSDKWMRRAAPLEATRAEQGEGSCRSLSDLSDLTCGTSFPEPRAQGDDLAALLYTSGSTGRAKGVMLSHRAILAFVEWAVERLRLDGNDRVSGVSPLQFDLSTLEIFGAMAAGARVCIAPAGASAFPETLAAFLESERISCWYSVPSVLMRLAEADLSVRDLDALREIPFAGEVFPPEALRQMMGSLPGARFHNFFGPTESNVCVAAVLNEAPGSGQPCPIGRAASGDQLEICDPDGAPVPNGTRGELWVSGPSLMSGYWNDAEGTAAALVRRDGRLWLRTGDEVSEEAGELWFHGRLDSMLKIRGFRVHPEAVEQVLCSHPGVRAACVALDGGELCAWVEASGVDPRALHRVCSKALPAYMVPTRMEITESLPRTERGKLIR